MRKNIFLILILLFTILINPISMVNASKDNEITVDNTTKSKSIDEASTIQPEQESYYNETWAQLTSTAFTADGNITEWIDEGIISEIFGGVEIYLAYDATSVYIALTWEDTTFSSSVSEWNKISTDDDFEMLPGADDIITVGFHNGSYADLWTWTASNRTHPDYALEHSWNNTMDSGTLPFVMNTNSTGFGLNSAPLWNNSWDIITDYSAIPLNTKIIGWFPNETIPTGSQSDVSVGWNYTGTHYVVEFVRLLDTGQADDIILDFTNNDLYFEIGVEDQNAAVNFDISLDSYLIFHENTPAELTFNSITNEVNESLLLQGTAFDDYDDYYVEIWIDEWSHTWGTSDRITVNKITGQWSYLCLFNEMDLPLGDINIYITIYPKYEEAISINQTTEVEDINPPNIIGIIDIGQMYPFGVHPDEMYVTVTVGLVDDYDDVNYLYANLYWIKDDGIALAQPMIQFYIDASTFQANITLDPLDDYTIQHNYTYFIQAWDLSANKIRSANYNFFTQTTETPIKPTTIISGIPFESIISSLIFIGCLIIIIRFKKR